MPHANIEAQAELILAEIITQAEKEQAALDVTASDTASWNSARLSIRLIEETEGELTKTATRVAVGNLYGVASETIRRRELVARLIQPGLVEAHPLLTFRHWQLASAARHMKDPIESALDIVWQINGYVEAYGKRPSVDTVYGWVYRDGNEYITTVWRGRAEGITSQLDKIFYDSYAPQEIRDLVGILRAMLSSYLETGISPLMGDPSDLVTATTKAKNLNKEGGPG